MQMKTLMLNTFRGALLGSALLAGLVFVRPALAETHEVRIIKYTFEPAEIRIKPGDTVRWKSYEKRGYHTVLFKAEGLPESDYMFPEESWERHFAKPGRYPYECGPHPEMQGMVLVE